MHATVEKSGKLRPVTNLGWLLRNWKQVESFTFDYRAHKTAWDGHTDGLLTAKLRDGGAYRTDFASAIVCFSFLRRPVFDSLTLTVTQDGKTRRHVIGSPEYRATLAAYNRPAPFVRGAYDNASQYRATLAAILPL